MTITVEEKGEITVLTDSRKLLGTVSVNSADFTEYTFEIEKTSGVKPLWLMFDGKGISVNGFRFHIK